MPTDVLLRTALTLLMFQLPLLVTAAVGLWFAFTKTELLARVALYAKWGFGLLIAYSLASVTLSVLTMQLRISARTESGIMLGDSLLWLNFIGLAAYPFFIVGIALIARAIFIGR